jgi:mRNA interferase MazF
MRGDIYSVAGNGYASKPRPAVIIQNDETDSFDSVIICLFTTDTSIDGPTRVSIQANKTNGLTRDCILMTDKVIAVKKSSLKTKIGTLSDKDMLRVDAALKITLGLN